MGKGRRIFRGSSKEEWVLQRSFIVNPVLSRGVMFKKSALLMIGKEGSKTYRKAWGFSIVELLVTIGILSTVLLIAIPNFQRIAVNGNLKTAARDVIADFNALRGRAMAENTQFDLTFNLSPTNTYTVSPASGLPNGGKTPASVASDIHLTSANFGGATTVSFRTRGTLSQAGNVVLINRRGSTATITCNLSGRIYVQFNML